MKTYWLRYYILGLLLLLPACDGNVKDRPLTQQVLKEKKVEEQLTQEERDLLAAYVVSKSMSIAFAGGDREDVFDGSITIGEAIETQRAWKQEQREQPDEESQATEKPPARNAELKIMRDLVSVVPVRKGVRENAPDEYLSLTLAITNHSNREIKGVKGSLIARDLFGDDILAFNVKDDDVLSARVRDVRTRFYQYDPAKEEHAAFRHMKFEKMTFEWNPEMIIFADGTAITIPEL